MSLFRKISTLSLVLALPLASFALQRAQLLPPNGQTYFRISNTVAFWEALQKSSLGQLWQDQQFQDFMGNPELEAWHNFFYDGDTDEETRVFVEQMEMLTGEVVLAFDSETENIFIIAAMSDDDFEQSLELDENLRTVTENPFDVVRRSFQGVEIIQHIDSPGTDNETSSWQTHIGNTFILGYNREWVEQCIIRLKNDPVTEPAGLPVFNMNLPVNDLIRQSLKGSSAEVAAKDQSLFNALGLLNVNYLSCRIEMHDDEMVVNSTLNARDLENGLFSLLDTEPSELPTVTFIPEDLTSLEVGRIDLPGLWQEIPAILQQIDPGTKPQFDMMLAMLQQQTGINLEQDLLENLGTQYLSFSIVENDSASSVIALELKDGMAFKQGLESALTSPSMQPYVAAALDISDFLNHSIYTLKQAPSDEQMGIAVTDDYLLYGNPDGLRQTLRAITSTGAANNAFEQSQLVQGLRRHVPSEAFGFSAIDWKKYMHIIVAELEHGEIPALIMQNWARSGSALPPPDFSKLPTAEHIAQFFNVSYQYIQAGNNGLHQKIILKY
ncbi:hypothetical protein [Pontiella agarivorans]|uniref:DUF3352 domain-containing protein n=1 Tax=Pontiella agarivorans TaxID=3038953 RepID=A0ABU5MXQ1_9BACT|nr:hypothetical protein [Pontiella agarivorans]MDZ8118918.1 hypothetical protein [Pontiella agarivorans]